MAEDRIDRPEDLLKGTSLKIYRLALTNGPIGTRQVQRKLELSSPSVAAHHLTRLERYGLLKSEGGGYMADKVLLREMVRFRHSLVPKYFFWFILFTSALIIQITFFVPEVLTAAFAFSFGITLLAALFFLYETIMTIAGDSI
ncbi:MAG: hypothetical protein ACE5KG_01715 [Nitrososphaerales archaeon]